MPENGREKIILTGIACRLGRLVARRLHRLGEYQIIAIDRRPVDKLPKDVEQLRVDIRSKRARDVFRRNVKAVVHLAVRPHPRSTAEQRWGGLGTSQLLEYCETYHVPKLVMLSSAEVYGARPDNPQFLTEDSPLAGSTASPGLASLVSADMQATSFFWKFRDSRTEAVVLRPVHVLGRLKNPASNYLRLSHVPVAMGFDPMVQVIHEHDVVEAIVAALQPDVHGVFNVTGPGELPLSTLLRELGRSKISVPFSLLGPTLNALWRAHLTEFAPSDLAYLRFVGMVDGRRGQQILGFRPHYGLRETVRAVLDSGEL